MSRRIAFFLLPGLLLLTFSGCAKTKVVYTGRYNGQPVKVLERETAGWFSVTNSITYFVQLGKEKRIPIGASNTDLYGAPYDAGIYKEVPHQFFENPITSQQTTPVGTPMVKPTMLYFNPATYSRAAYDAYADFFAHAWPAINKEINTGYPYINKQVIGTVWGAHDDFVQLFIGEEEGVPYYFDVQPSGFIQYHQGRGPAQSTGFQGSGLAATVEMPGRIIRIEYPDALSPEKLRRYKDKKGKSMEDYFTIGVGKK